MPVFILPERGTEFPPPELANSEGLLAIGGDLSVTRVETAYRSGIFPWYQQLDTPILWWSPDPRFVLLPENLHIPHSLAKILKRGFFNFSIDRAFEAVMHGCAASRRTDGFTPQEESEAEFAEPDDDAEGFSPEGEPGCEYLPAECSCGKDDVEDFGHTWLGPNMMEAYLRLHKAGLAHSVEAWRNGELVGGFYGVTFGSVFFGESMFYVLPNASKAAFAWFMEVLKKRGCSMVDCQQNTAHLGRFGARDMTRLEFLARLAAAQKHENMF